MNKAMSMMNRLSFVLPRALFAVAALSGATLFASNVSAQEMTQEKFNQMMDSYLKSSKGPESILNAIQSHVQKKQQESAQAGLDEQFKNPVKIEIGDSPVKGPANAKVTVVEFSDFQCPFCKRGKDVMDQLLQAYPNDVKVVFKNLPLHIHDEAAPAAKAALAAGKQGKFWEMHDALFAKQGELGEKLYLEEAKKLGLDLEKFKNDMASEAIAKQIEAEAALAGDLGITGTPCFFVNGVAVRGAYPLSHFKMIVDRWLKEGSKS